MRDIAVDVTSWPLVRVRFPRLRVGDAEFDRFVERVESLFRGDSQHALVVDALAVRQGLSASQLLRVTRLTRAHRDLVASKNVGTALVFRAAGARGVLSAYYWMTGDVPTNHALFDTVEDAERWCRERLALAGVTFERTASRSAPTPTPTPDRPARYGGAPLPRTTQIVETHAPIVDMFREVAFIVDGFGTILHANEAARRAYPDAPTWLGRVVSDASRASVPDCRIMPLDGDREIYLVIPSGSLRPDSAPPPATELPPSLERIALLLVRGSTDKEIAHELDLPVTTVRTYVTRIYRRLGVSSRAQLAHVFRGPGSGGSDGSRR